jgi:hypothetical protein
MVEIEIGVLRGQCLDRRIGERETLVADVEAWQQRRNASGARINWQFTTQKARHKPANACPDAAKPILVSFRRCHTTHDSAPVCVK